MGKCAVDSGVGTGTDGGVVLGVGVIVGDGTKDHAEVLYDREGEKEGYTPESRGRGGKSKANEVVVE